MVRLKSSTQPQPSQFRSNCLDRSKLRRQKVYNSMSLNQKYRRKTTSPAFSKAARGNLDWDATQEAQDFAVTLVQYAWRRHDRNECIQ